jgi:hypothetical protein
MNSRHDCPALSGSRPNYSKTSSEAGSGNETTRDVDHGIKLVKRESERQVLVEMRERENWVHRSVVKK